MPLGILVALLVSAAESGAGQLPEARPELRKLGLSFAVGLDTQWVPDGRFANVGFWGELDVSFRALRWLRLELLSGAAWSPENRPSFPGQHGTFRVLAGADLVGALRWGELFVGAAGGIQHTNLFGDEDYPSHPGYSTSWGSGPCLLARLGVDVRVLENFSIGGALAYSLFVSIDTQHSGELRARFTFLF